MQLNLCTSAARAFLIFKILVFIHNANSFTTHPTVALRFNKLTEPNNNVKVKNFQLSPLHSCTSLFSLHNDDDVLISANNNESTKSTKIETNAVDNSRRRAFKTCILSCSTLLLSNNPSYTIANAATTSSNVVDKIAKKFKRVPLFAIVSSKDGLPFMILDAESTTATAQSLFFTSYEGAKVVLDDTRKDVADNDEKNKEIWDNARISAVNMEFALKLAKGKVKATAVQNNVKYDIVYDIIPTRNALNEANALDESGFYNDRGRLPLFYSDEFEIGPEEESSGGSGKNRVPIFLETSDLFREFRKKYPDKPNLTITVIDFNELFSAMIGSGNIRGFDKRLTEGNIYLVPSIESRKKAVELEKERGNIPAFKVGEMFAVGGSAAT